MTGTAAGQRPFRWERSYPHGIAWDAAIETTTLGDHLARAVGRYANRVVIQCRDARITYRALADMAARAAAAFAAMPEAASGVALYLPNTPFHTVAFYGAAIAGRRLVQLSPLDAPRELAHKLTDSGARVLVTLALPALLDNAVRLRGEGLLDRVIVADDARWGAGPPSAPLPDDAVPFDAILRTPPLDPWPSWDKEDVALLQYTGGTTGLPKGAMLTHANLTTTANCWSLWLTGGEPIAEDERKAILILPLFHIFALSLMNHYIAAGYEVLMRLRFDPEQCARDIEAFRASSLCGVPTQFIALLNLPDIEARDLTSLRSVRAGGAPLPIGIGARFTRLSGAPLSSNWGMTEGAALGLMHPVGAPTKPATSGLPPPGVEISVVAFDDPRRELPPGETGEIRMRGPSLMKGYWNRPEETAMAFVDGWFLTGDVGRMDEDGFVTFTDRRKDMILTAGFNVYPQVVEDAIYEHPAVAECIVIGIPDDYRGQAVKAYVTLRPGAQAFALEELRAFLTDRLGKHELPLALEIRDSLPRTSVGKLSKRMLIEEVQAGRAASSAPN